MRFCHFQILLLCAVGFIGCNESNSPEGMPDALKQAKQLTLQQDGYIESEAQITANEGFIFYLLAYDDSTHSLIEQDINEQYRAAWWVTWGSPVTMSCLRMSSNQSFFVYVIDGFFIVKWDPYAGGHGDVVLTRFPATTPRISPDDTWIAYQCDYPSEPAGNVYIMTPDGDATGVYHQVSHSENAPSGFTYSFLPVSWLSSTELVIRRKRNQSPGSMVTVYDMLKYDVSDLAAEPELLTTTIGDENQPMGYSEVMNQTEGWYVASLGDPQSGYSNLYKCPLGVAGDWGEQLTFGGHHDVATDITADGNRILFVRNYRKGPVFLTGPTDIYLYDLGSNSISYACENTGGWN